MIKPIEWRIFKGQDFIPCMRARKPPSHFEGRCGLRFTEHLDDLGESTGAVFECEGRIFALMKYRGEPENTTTLYILGDPRKIPSADSEIKSVMRELGLSDEDVEHGEQ